MKCINEGHILKSYEWYIDVTVSYLKCKIYYKTFVQNIFSQKTTTLIILSTKLHLSKSNECHQLFLLYGGRMAASFHMSMVIF